MYTRCPHCQTYFKISTEQLKKAGGKVRCGQCTKVFNSLGNLLEDLPVALSERSKPAAQPPGPPAARPSGPPPPKPAPKPLPPKPAAPIIPPRPAPKPASKVPVQSTAAGEDSLIFQTNESRPQTVTSEERDTLHLTDEDKIEYVPGGPFSSVRDMVLYPGPREETTSSFGNAFWGTGVGVLLTIFILQYSYAMRDDLARYPELRPWVQKMCAVAQCDVPMQQNVDLIKLTHRDITIHPRVKGALLINAVFVNNANFTQSFPLMQITLSDVNGRIIAKRRFQPVEYLDADVNIRRGMAPNTPIQIVLEIGDPGKDAVNFEFNFFYQTS